MTGAEQLAHSLRAGTPELAAIPVAAHALWELTL